ncbi:hypothetical protein P12x_001966 [Tundrisphaera lichenicola]|uniref:hypothetical protein n=1 Tax=Tundrisphaera lichenicola TaxID=2029860 RepID=UPI003EBC612B
MSRIIHDRSLWLGSLALIAALAPAAPTLDPADDVKELAKARVKVAQEILKQYREYLLAPAGEKGIPAPLVVAEEIQGWTRKVFEARLEAASDAAERLGILAEEVKAAVDFEDQVKALVGGNPTGLDRMSVSKAEFIRLEAESRLAREKAGK